MNKRKIRVGLVLSFLVVFVFWVSISTASSDINSIQYPLTPMNPTLYDQGVDNYCGPGSLQSVIQFVNQYNNGWPTGTVVPIIAKTQIMGFMVQTPCSALGGRDNPLQGRPYSDAPNDIRKLNISFDMGADPHAMAWSMYHYTGAGYYYHYWIYASNNPDLATRNLLFSLEKFHEPVIVSVWHGAHWIYVDGYESEYPAATEDGWINDPGNITRIKIGDTYHYDPLTYVPWVAYNSGSTSWLSYYFTSYTDIRDPDPATGWYVPPPDHWKNHLVAIERDVLGEYNPDFGMSKNG